ncbi:hypothetical protein FQR65_LT17023 [Abscondita terminalis]|nr:hypothetical protein FQR65_LT17023 [Abscondita terminalis]
MTRPAHAKKDEIVKDISKRITSNDGMVIAEYKNLTVAQLTDLRNLARAENIYIKVYKDSLFRRAAQESKLDGLIPFLTQQNIYLFSEEEGIAPAKLVAKFAKKNPDLVLKAGIYQGEENKTMAITKDDIIKALEEMKLAELNDLVKAIEDHFGVVAAAAVAAPAGGGDAAAAPSEVNVMLTSAGGNKVAVIKVVKELTGLGLMDAKKLVDGTLPVAIKESVKVEEAEEIKKQLVEAGASVELK